MRIVTSIPSVDGMTIPLPAALLAATLAIAPVTPSPVHAADPESGALISVTPLDTLSRHQAVDSLRSGSWGKRRLTHGVSAYRVTYATTGVDGEPTQATGVLALPSDAAGELTAVSYFHGTGSYKPEVASSWRDPYNTAPAVLLAGKGFAAMLPDYLGLGDSPGTHPWMHVASETSAAADMLTASRQAAAELGTPLRERTHVIGFSQGASVALATSRALQEGAVSGATTGRTFAISGAYDLRGSELPALLAGGQILPEYAIAYTTYLLVAWDRLWPLYDRTTELFRQPYADRVERLFDGSTPGPRMLAALPRRLDDLLTPAGLRLLRHPTPALRAGLRQADAVCRWTPGGRIDLYVTADDEQAVAANTDACASRLRAHGATVEVHDVGTPLVFGSPHIGTNIAGTVDAVRRLARAERS